MITSALIATAYYIVYALTAVFPSGAGFPAAVHDSVVTMASYMLFVDYIIPIDTLFTCLVIVLSFELTVAAFRFVRWVVSYIPFIGGKGN